MDLHASTWAGPGQRCTDVVAASSDGLLSAVKKRSTTCRASSNLVGLVALFVGPLACVSEGEEDTVADTELQEEGGTEPETLAPSLKEEGEIVKDEGGQAQSAEAELQAYELFLHETALQNPPASDFEFIGYVAPDDGTDIWIHDAPPSPSIQTLLAKHGVDQAVASDKNGVADDVARGVLVSADGRVFVEREEVVETRRQQLAFMPPAKRSGPNYPEDGDSDEDNEGVEPELTPSEWPGEAKPSTRLIPDSGASSQHGPHSLADLPRVLGDKIWGNDDRKLVTSSATPWRQVGVQGWRLNNGSWVRSGGSLEMIGPRAALTVAHVITKSGSTITIQGIAPAARGISWSGDPVPPEGQSNSKFPFGVRRLQWVYFPSQWPGSGGDIAWDYGVVIMNDINWSPGWIWFGYKPCSGTNGLDWRNHNMAGYPGSSKECLDSPNSNGTCGGYMYRQYERTRSCSVNTLWHEFDVQEGQSGAPVYQYHSSSGSRTVYAMHKSSSDYSRAKRIREGSFSTICSWMHNWPSSYWANPSC
jgi:V8-like Glu-specific endopeptidase